MLELLYILFEIESFPIIGNEKLLLFGQYLEIVHDTTLVSPFPLVWNKF